MRNKISRTSLNNMNSLIKTERMKTAHPKIIGNLSHHPMVLAAIIIIMFRLSVKKIN